MIEGLRRNGIEVIEVHERLWRGVEDRVEVASGGWLRMGFALRLLKAYWGLLKRHRRAGAYDVMVLGYPGQIDLYLARILTWFRRKPLVLDVFMSLYLIARERGVTDRRPVTARVIRWIERVSCWLADRLILDTPEYVAWFADTFRLSPQRFRLVPTGADDRLFKPVNSQGAWARTVEGPLRVVYYGTFIPNHGTLTIVAGASLLAGEETIRFELIGRGPDRERAAALAKRHGLANVEFVDWLEKETLLERVAHADICLGAFGTTPQSMMTIQNKIYEGLAMAKPVLTGDSATVRRTLRHAEHVYLCQRANPRALAEAIRTLAASPELRERLAAQGYRLFVEQFDLEHNGARFASYLYEVVSV
jgi:glycosyltransferase involved in cell wall biosynthesis